MSETEKLKPCPACGNEAEKKRYKKYRTGFEATVGCTKCVLRVSQATLRGTRDDAWGYAIATWNCQPLVMELLEALENCVEDYCNWDCTVVDKENCTVCGSMAEYRKIIAKVKGVHNAHH